MSEVKESWFAVMHRESRPERLYLGEWDSERSAELIFGSLLAPPNPDLPGFVLVRSDGFPYRKWVSIASIKAVTFETGPKPNYEAG